MEETSNLQKTTLEQVDERIVELEEQIEIGAALDRLHTNPDFTKVFLEGYLEAEAERLFRTLVTPSTIKRDAMENMMDKLTAIRNVKTYIKTCYQNAIMAPEQIEQEKLYRKEVTSGDTLDSEE